MSRATPIPHISEPLLDAGTQKINDNWFRYLEELNVFKPWTPVLTFATPGDLSVTYSAQLGSYTRIGRVVVAMFNVTTSVFTHTTAAGALRITGLPVKGDSVVTPMYGKVAWSGITKANYTEVACHVADDEAVLEFTASGSAQTASSVASTDVPTGGTPFLRGTIVYHA